MTSNYWVSTQCNHWLVTRAQIAIARAEDSIYTQSAEEHYALRIFLINCLSLLAKRLFLRQRVTVTAIVFFHRFYSCAPANSLSSTDPFLVITACIYVASKVEETPIHIRVVSNDAQRLWEEMGNTEFDGSTTAIAEMEFYLLEDLHFHLVVHHPFRSLVAIYTASGKPAAVRPNLKQSAATSWNDLLGSSLAQVLGTSSTAATSNAPSQHATPTGAGDLGSAPTPMEPDLAYGSPGAGLAGRKTDEGAAAISGELQKVRQLDKETQARVMQEMMEERNRMFIYAGDDDMPLPRLDEFDEQVLQMAWFVLNDSYRTDLLLTYPPHVVAVAALFLGLVLNDNTREKMWKSKRWMDDSRERYHKETSGAYEWPAGTPSDHAPTKSTPGTSNPPTSHNTPAAQSPAATKASPANATAASPTGLERPATPASGPSQPTAQPLTAQQPTNQQPGKPAPRGLASLPPRPSHLPPKPMVTPGQSWQMSPATSGSGRPGTPSATSTNGNAAPLQPSAVPDNTSGVAPKASPAGSQSTIDGGPQARVGVPHLPTPPPDALTFLAALNVDLDAVAEVVQEMLSLYDFWHRVGTRNGAGDGTDGSSKVNASAIASVNSPRDPTTPAGSSSLDGSVATPLTANAEPASGSTSAKEEGTERNGVKDLAADIYIGHAPDMLARLKRMRGQRQRELHELAQDAARTL